MYLLSVVFVSLLVSTKCTKDCVVRMELVDNRFIKLINDEELCKCLGFGITLGAKNSTKIESNCDIETFSDHGSLSFSALNICGCAGYGPDDMEEYRKVYTELESLEKSDEKTKFSDGTEKINKTVSFLDRPTTVDDTTESTVETITNTYNSNNSSTEAYYDELTNETYTSERNDLPTFKSDDSIHNNKTDITSDDTFKENTNKSETSEKPVVRSHIITFWNNTNSTTVTFSSKTEFEIPIHVTRSLNNETRNYTTTTVSPRTLNIKINNSEEAVTNATYYSKETKIHDELIIPILRKYSNWSTTTSSDSEERNLNNNSLANDDLIVAINNRYNNDTIHPEKYVETAYFNHSGSKWFEESSYTNLTDFEDQEDSEEEYIISGDGSNIPENMEKQNRTSEADDRKLNPTTKRFTDVEQPESSPEVSKSSVSQQEASSSDLIYWIVLIDTCVIIVLTVVLAVYIYYWCTKKGYYTVTQDAGNVNNLEMEGSYQRP